MMERSVKINPISVEDRGSVITLLPASKSITLREISYSFLTTDYRINL